MKKFSERLADPRPLLYDGGFGSQLFARDVQLTNSTLANESHPDVVIDVHTAYIEAGSDVIGTNTFVASPLHLKMAGVEGSEVDKIVQMAGKNARSAVERSDRDVYVAGSIGPSPGAIEEDAGNTDFGIPNKDVIEAHERVINGLAEAGVDFFCIETMFSAKEAAMAVNIARKMGLPIAVNMTYKSTQNRKTGELVYRTDWGHSPRDLVELLMSGEFSDGENLLPYVHLMGLNCGAESKHSEHSGIPYAIHGTRQLAQAMSDLGVDPPKKMMAYPNAGMPCLGKDLKTYYSQTPDDMAGQLADLLDAGAYFVGGCCGTGPDHIKKFREIIDKRLAG